MVHLTTVKSAEVNFTIWQTWNVIFQELTNKIWKMLPRCTAIQPSSQMFTSAWSAARAFCTTRQHKGSHQESRTYNEPLLRAEQGRPGVGIGFVAGDWSNIDRENFQKGVIKQFNKWAEYSRRYKRMAEPLCLLMPTLLRVRNTIAFDLCISY